ncbi:GPI mannosyltransferase 4 [Podosphaera aphanis]|nr:GPI mannosyltransferase 4 [Podosphaera aphanis]
MWRRAYLFFVLVRLYFALSPSYLHPDENFQGPEVIAGQIFGYPIQMTWEFTSDKPVRSVFPLWPVYGLPMLLLRWLWMGNGNDGKLVPSYAVFWSLRILMFTLSFVLEDWALYELVQLPRHRRVAVILVASSYVTWTYQTHTFSNSIETLVVAWSLVLIQKILENKKRSSSITAAILGLIVVFGTFNRITFPAFLFIPGLQLIPHFIKRPWGLLTLTLSTLTFSLIAIFVDTNFYSEHNVKWSELLSHPIITPINNLKYNFSKKNLALHGLHPWYQHLFFNLPQLVGPAVILVFNRPNLSLRFYSAMSGILVLSFFQHQEARFLLPAVPCLLTSVNLPQRKTLFRLWIGVWIIFNAFLGILMGVYHQGGVIPTQVFLSKQPYAAHAVWWKTYSPPIWLLNGKTEIIKTHDKMGMEGSLMIRELETLATCHESDTNSSAFLDEKERTFLIAPLSATFLDKYTTSKGVRTLRFHEIWRYKNHLNLDDLDIGNDGFWLTMKRVIGRRGLAIWRVTKECG